MVFLPQNMERRLVIQQLIEDVCRSNELEFIGWRDVPIDVSVLGDSARMAQPYIMQFFVRAPKRLQPTDNIERDGFERTLYLVRRRFSVERMKRGLIWDDNDNEVYFASYSSRTNCL
jgi:glutamate synthase domain-containing protein 1